jgi:hypothetical protein
MKKQLYAHIEALVFKNEIPDIPHQQWQCIINLLREVNLLASCYFSFKRAHKLALLPHFALKHFTAASVYSTRQAIQVTYESQLLVQILAKVDITPVFLKGASYTLRDSINASGRVYSDIDVLVNKEQISLAEKTLSKHGWHTKTVNEYDDKYYRQWSHEIPPMFNIHRGTVLDLHHNILLPISGRHVDVKILTQNLLTFNENYAVLSPEATVIHSVVHLIINEDVANGYRDILDIVRFIEENASDEFWHKLVNLSQSLGFHNELYIALTIANKYSSIPIPANVILSFAQQQKSFRLNMLVNHIYYWALQPHSPTIQTKQHKMAIIAVYILGHLKKMPLKVLLPHLTTKLFFSIRAGIFGKHHFDK